MKASPGSERAHQDAEYMALPRVFRARKFKKTAKHCTMTVAAEILRALMSNSSTHLLAVILECHSIICVFGCNMFS